MKNEPQQITTPRKPNLVPVSTRILKSAALALALIVTITLVDPIHARPKSLQKDSQPPSPPTQNPPAFYCNAHALDPAARLRHKNLTDKLLASRTAIVENDKGYEFQFSPSNVSLDELATWAIDESKCCPFFDFHIDLENRGTLLCLRLTGQPGIKDFIRAEFHFPPHNSTQP